MNARSDQLGDLQELLELFNNPLRPLLTKIVSAKIIIDANVAYRAILWMAKKRTNPEAQPDIIEIARTGFAEIHAPNFIKDEVNKYLPEISEKSGKHLSEIETLWAEFSANMYFHNTQDLPPLEGDCLDIDPKDGPYIQLQRLLKHPIVSHDQDISEMGGHTTDIVVINRLKDLYRLNATEYQIAITGYGVLFLGSHAVGGIFTLLKQGISKILNLPEEYYPLLAIVSIIIYKDPKLREKFGILFEGLISLIPGLVEELMKHTDGAISQATEAKSKAAEITKQLPGDFQTRE